MSLIRDARTAVGQGEAVKKLRGIQICEKKIVVLCLLLFNNDVDQKKIPEIVENQFEVSRCANRCNKIVSIRF